MGDYSKYSDHLRLPLERRCSGSLLAIRFGAFHGMVSQFERMYWLRVKQIINEIFVTFFLLSA